MLPVQAIPPPLINPSNILSFVSLHLVDGLPSAFPSVRTSVCVSFSLLLFSFSHHPLSPSPPPHLSLSLHSLTPLPWALGINAGLKNCSPWKWHLNEHVAMASCLTGTGSSDESSTNASVLTLLPWINGHIPAARSHLQRLLVQALNLKKKMVVLLQTTLQLEN